MTATPEQKYKLQRANPKKRMYKDQLNQCISTYRRIFFEKSLQCLIQHSFKGLLLVAQGVHP